MTVQRVTLRLPKPLYRRASHAANALQQPLEEISIRTLDTALPPLDEIPAEIRAEVDSLNNLSDDALWEIAQSTMATPHQERLDVLLDAQGARALTAAEASELEKMRMEYGRTLLRRAKAYALLSRWHPPQDCQGRPAEIT